LENEDEGKAIDLAFGKEKSHEERSGLRIFRKGFAIREFTSTRFV